VNQLEKLLKQWSNLDPEKCKKSVAEPNLFRIYGFLVNPSAFDLNVLAFVQISVQKAISGRDGWEMILELDRHPADGKPVWIAAVFRPRDIDGFKSSSDEPSIALLESYLAALAAD
jgi:hypothetical protein